MRLLSILKKCFFERIYKRKNHDIFMEIREKN
jgi:hypothetical protein